MIVLWCNGSTTGFGSVCPGSNPGKTTIATLADSLPGVAVIFVCRCLFFKKSGYTPEHGALSVVVANVTTAIVIVLLAVLFVGTFAHIVNLIALVDIINKGEPAFASNGAVCFGVEPTAFSRHLSWRRGT